VTIKVYRIFFCNSRHSSVNRVYFKRLTAYFCAKPEKMNLLNCRSVSMFVAFAVAATSLNSCGNSAPTEQPTADTATAQAAPPARTIADLKWLAGKWQQTIKEGTLFENWTIAAADSMAGVSGLIHGKDTLISETIALTFRDGAIIYSPSVSGQNNNQPVPFKLTRSTADSFIFENPAHDFPSMISYVRINTDSLIATISGNPGGKPISESFYMGRVSRD